jgi:hypothetical protein
MTVNEAGKAEDIEVVDGFYEKRFVDAAIQYIRRMEFSPANRNGVPERYEGLRYAVKFQIGTERIMGVTPNFRKELDKAVQLIREDKPAEAQSQVNHMLAEEVTLLYEVGVMYAILAETSHQNGKLIDALYYSRKASEPLDFSFPGYQPGKSPPQNKIRRYSLPKEMLEAVLRRRIYLDANLGYPVDGLQAYWELTGFGPLSPDDGMVKLAADMQRLAESGKPVTAQAVIPSIGSWHHLPVRRAFTVMSVAGGRLEKVIVSCGKSYYRRLPFQSDVDWILPARFDRCGIRFEGDPGTRFRIVEAELSADADPEGAISRGAGTP